MPKAVRVIVTERMMARWISAGAMIKAVAIKSALSNTNPMAALYVSLAMVFDSLSSNFGICSKRAMVFAIVTLSIAFR